MTDPPFEYRIEQRPGAIDVVLDGEIDMAAVFKLEPALDALGDDVDGTDVTIDLRPATFIDSTGMGLLTGTYERLTRNGARMRFVRASPEVMRAFEVSGLGDALPFVERDAST